MLQIPWICHSVSIRPPPQCRDYLGKYLGPPVISDHPVRIICIVCPVTIVCWPWWPLCGDHGDHGTGVLIRPRCVKRRRSGDNKKCDCRCCDAPFIICSLIMTIVWSEGPGGPGRREIEVMTVSNTTTMSDLCRQYFIIIWFIWFFAKNESSLVTCNQDNDEKVGERGEDTLSYFLLSAWSFNLFRQRRHRRRKLDEASPTNAS